MAAGSRGGGGGGDTLTVFKSRMISRSSRASPPAHCRDRSFRTRPDFIIAFLSLFVKSSLALRELHARDCTCVSCMCRACILKRETYEEKQWNLYTFLNGRIWTKNDKTGPMCHSMCHSRTVVVNHGDVCIGYTTSNGTIDCSFSGGECILVFSLCVAYLLSICDVQWRIQDLQL